MKFKRIVPRFLLRVSRKGIPSRHCVVQGCSNVPDILAGISVHKSLIDKTLRAKWKAFVGTHCAHFNPDGHYAVCSDHFSPDSFERSVHMDGTVRRLKKGSFPTIWKKPGKTVIKEPLLKQGSRMVSSTELIWFSRILLSAQYVD